MSADGSSRIAAAVLAVVALFGACRDFGGNSSSDGGRGGATGGASGEQGGKSGAAGTGGSARGGAGGTAVSGGGGGRAGDGEGGEAGSGQGGGSGADAGSAGEGATGGMGGDGPDGPDCWLDQTVVPECFSLPPPADSPTILFARARSAAILGLDAYDGRFQLFTTVQGSHTLGSAHTPEVSHNGFFGWYCFDAVPYPDRVAAATLYDNEAQEVWVTTRCGRVYVRRYFLSNPEGWSSWVPLELPSKNSFVTDVSFARSDESNLVFIVDRGKVFVARKDAPYGPYGPWNEVTTNAGALLAAGVRGDGRNQIFTIDQDGRPRTSIQTTTDLDAPFGTWTSFGSDLGLGLVDIDVPHNMSETFLVLALDEEGGIWASEENGAGSFGDWQTLGVAASPDVMLTLAGAGIPSRTQDRPFMLVGVGRGGPVYTARRANSVWEPWRQLFQ